MADALTNMAMDTKTSTQVLEADLECLPLAWSNVTESLQGTSVTGWLLIPTRTTTQTSLAGIPTLACHLDMHVLVPEGVASKLAEDIYRRHQVIGDAVDANESKHTQPKISMLKELSSTGREPKAKAVQGLTGLTGAGWVGPAITSIRNGHELGYRTLK
ncbi:hypothetical protein ON010_g1430 [Phytophthora cinnamomi]|nr:hypothetical protein ON010_g1430 [Phytophthora cinnamomi]